MCEHGNNVTLRVCIPADCSHTGEARWDDKPVDSCIAPLVQALNDAGALTSAACCGHGEGPGSIILHSGQEIMLGVAKGFQLTPPEPVGNDWAWAVEQLSNGKAVRRVHWCPEASVGLDDLGSVETRYLGECDPELPLDPDDFRATDWVEASGENAEGSGETSREAPSTPESLAEGSGETSREAPSTSESLAEGSGEASLEWKIFPMGDGLAPEEGARSERFPRVPGGVAPYVASISERGPSVEWPGRTAEQIHLVERWVAEFINERCGDCETVGDVRARVNARLVLEHRAPSPRGWNFTRVVIQADQTIPPGELHASREAPSPPESLAKGSGVTPREAPSPPESLAEGSGVTPREAPSTPEPSGNDRLPRTSLADLISGYEQGLNPEQLKNFKKHLADGEKNARRAADYELRRRLGVVRFAAVAHAQVTPCKRDSFPSYCWPEGECTICDLNRALDLTTDDELEKVRVEYGVVGTWPDRVPQTQAEQMAVVLGKLVDEEIANQGGKS